MKMNILKQEKNPFMDREEFMIEIKNEVTPSFDEIKKELKKDNDLTVVKKVHTNFGRTSFVAEVFVYNNKEALKRIETIPKKVRKKLEAEERAAAAAKAQEKAE